jgi:hypothetical protein
VGGQHLPQLLGRALAERGQLDAAPALDEQRLAQLLVQSPDVAADRRLGQVQRLGGAAVAAVADDRQERAQVCRIEVDTDMIAPIAPIRKGPITNAYRFRRSP